MKNQVILVDKNDNQIGTEEKLIAHQQAKLHRAFSVFIYRLTNHKPELLLQQRNQKKYHCGSLWSNTCCSHPQPGSTVLQAATKRLNEEMGITAELRPIGKFTYRAEFPNGLTEHEIDHVFIGKLQQDHFTINPQEVADYRWVTIDELASELKHNPESYTPWLGEVLLLARGEL